LKYFSQSNIQSLRIIDDIYFVFDNEKIYFNYNDNNWMFINEVHSIHLVLIIIWFINVVFFILIINQYIYFIRMMIIE